MWVRKAVGGKKKGDLEEIKAEEWCIYCVYIVADLASHLEALYICIYQAESFSNLES